MNRKEFTELLLNQDVTYRAAYAKSAIGAERYLQRDESIAFSYGEQIVLTQENIGISLPSDYVHFYSSFDVKNAIGDLLDLPDDFCNGGGFSDINNGNDLYFSHFIEHDEILEHWEYVNQYDQEAYRWNILKIAQTPWQGGFYLGFGKENFGKVYWVRTEFIPENFRLTDLSEKHRDGIRLVADSFTEFLNGLRYFFGESPEY